MSTFEFLTALMKKVGLSGFFAGNAVAHGGFKWFGPLAQRLDQASLRQRLVSTIFGDRLKRTGCGFYDHKFFEFGDPDALGFEIGLVPSGRNGSHVHADAAFFLGQTAPVNL